MNIYSDELLLAVWSKAEEVYGYDARIWRKDFAGAWIRYDHYGMKDSFGWQIDHKRPQAQGGTDDNKKSSTASVGKQFGKIR